MQRCAKCNTYKPIDEFYSRGRGTGRRGPYCKPCQRQYCRAHYLRNKESHNKRRYANNKRYLHRNHEFIKGYLATHYCVDCGESDPVVLEFDHVGADKLWEVAHMVRSAYPLHRIKAEILKCEVRCANCHRRKTARDFGWYKVGA